MNSLVIYLPVTAPGAASGYDYVTTPDGTMLKDHGCVPSTLLPQVERSGEVVAVVPVTLLSWHGVDLPKGVGPGSPRLRPILEGLLEDRLLDDATQLHLSLEPAVGNAGGRAWVAACDRSWLRGHLQALEAAGRTVTRVVPEFAPDPGPLKLHAINDAGWPQLVITGKGSDGVMRLPLTAAALVLVPSGFAEEEKTMLAEPAVAEMAEQLLQRKVGLMTRTQRWLDASRSRWDLAQFDLASSGRSRTLKRLSGGARQLLQAPVWRPARWGLVLLLLVNLVGLNAWSWQTQNTLQERRAAVNATLTQTFPQVRLVVDAPLQMERELAALRQASGATSGRDLEAILVALGSTAPADVSAGAIEFVAGQARLKGLKLSVPQASQVSDQLKRLGYAARQEADTFFIQQATGPGGSP